MVGTRSHPSGEYPATPTPGAKSAAATPSTSTTVARRAASRGPASRSPTAWTHTPSTLTLLWLALSLPLVTWDTVYILGRPATMPGGWAHRPLFVPYALYGAIDGVYGMPSILARDGFGAAQGALNALETAGYVVYLYIVGVHGVQGRAGSRSGRGAKAWLGPLARPRVVGGRAGAVAPVLGLVMAALTLAKTVLYWLNEYFSGFKYVGHNSAFDLVLLWIIPNGMWLIFPTYMIYVFWNEVVEGLENSVGVEVKKRN